MKLSPLAISAIAKDAGLLDPKAWPQRKRDSSTVMILAHGPDKARKLIELPRNAKEADVRRTLSERAV